MKKIYTTLSSWISFPLKILKKLKFDTFLGGLILGAVFSLMVNVVTVKIQETVNKQRALESLEREIVYHLLTINTVTTESANAIKASAGTRINIDDLMNQRFSTEVWDRGDVYKYLLELDPKIAPKVELYYSALVDGTNRILDDNYKTYNDLYQPCRPFYSIITGKVPQSLDFCNQITKAFANLQLNSIELIVNNLDETVKDFHPTRDRLDSFWLKLLLGNKSVKILQ